MNGRRLNSIVAAAPAELAAALEADPTVLPLNSGRSAIQRNDARRLPVILSGGLARSAPWTADRYPWE